MADTMIKRTALGLVLLEITLEGEASKIPAEEITDLIRILRETADNFESIMKHCATGSALPSSLHVH